MNALQSRMHAEVCEKAGLTSCLCGSYARVGEEWAREEVERSDNHGMCVAAKDYDDQVKHTNLVRSEYLKRLDAALVRETRLREALGKHECPLDIRPGRPSHVVWCPNHGVYHSPDIDAALSAGAGEK